MDPRFNRFPSSVNGFNLENQSLLNFSDNWKNNEPIIGAIYPDQKLVNGPRFGNSFVQHNVGGVQSLSNDPSLPTSNIALTSEIGTEDDYNEDFDFSDTVLSYINQMLMEEDMEDKTHMLQESLELQAQERSFYEALGKKYPPSPQQNLSITDQNGEIPDDYCSGSLYDCTSNVIDSSGYLIDPRVVSISNDHNSSYEQGFSVCNGTYSSISSSNSINNLVDGFLDSPVSPLHIPDVYNDSHPIWNFRKGVEEASKFLPTNNKLLDNVVINDLLPQEKRGESGCAAAQVAKRDEGETSPTGPRVRKNPYRDDKDLEEERSNKQAAVYTESTVRSEEFDVVLLHSLGDGRAALTAYRESLKNARTKTMVQNGQSKGFTVGKGRGKKHRAKKEVIDLRTLLINSAQAVAADDCRSATELLKQIRLHSSPFGDGNQRLAHCFADGLEARLAGTGSQIYKALINKKTSAADFLKAYHLYLASCPFRKISGFASNKTIMTKSGNATRVHVIDFGILYGFQWPTFIQRIAAREGGPPKLRITGIEFPQPGFRPAERIEETGRRLIDYAKSFNVPFEYQAIAKKWEAIRLDDLKLEKDEFLVVNCLYRFKNLHDETVLTNSSRTIVLNLIRTINPDIFIHGIVNGAYSAPFFVTRFREVLFHFSALFDMLEINVPREFPERMLIEREIFGREALNVIACEGWERVERPETYKQWRVRHLRARFTQIPFEREIMNRAVEKVRTSYHKDFVIDQDNEWMLLGWKGRTIYAISCWTPI